MLDNEVLEALRDIKEMLDGMADTQERIEQALNPPSETGDFINKERW